MRAILLSATAAGVIALAGPAIAADTSSPNVVNKQAPVGEVHKRANIRTENPILTTQDNQFRAWSSLREDEREQIAEFDSLDMTAAELIATDVVDQNGTKVGEIEDLLFTSENEAALAILDLTEDAGFEQDFVAVDIGSLRMAEGGESDLVLQFPRSEIAELEAYELKEGVGWGEKQLR
jgi:hypothetical protein